MLFWNNRAGISSFRAATTPRRRCAAAAALIRRECAGRKVRAIPINLLALASFIWPDITIKQGKPVPTPAAHGRRVKLYEPNANDSNNIKILVMNARGRHIPHEDK